MNSKFYGVKEQKLYEHAEITSVVNCILPQQSFNVTLSLNDNVLAPPGVHTHTTVGPR